MCVKIVPLLQGVHTHAEAVVCLAVVLAVVTQKLAAANDLTGAGVTHHQLKASRRQCNRLCHCKISRLIFAACMPKNILEAALANCDPLSLFVLREHDHKRIGG